MQKITPFLWFDHEAGEAMDFYTRVFENGRITGASYVNDGREGGRKQILMGTFEIAGTSFMAINAGPDFKFTPAISFFAWCETPEQIDALWASLSTGGQVLMEYGTYPFSEKYGWVVDRFGVSWQLFLNGQKQSISPCLMFTGAQAGRAEEAMNFYLSLFDNSSIEFISRYGAEQEGEPPESVNHARFILAGQPFAAMDSSYPHGFNFTPATSFFVNCRSQEEVDYYWDRFTEGGEPGQCGWLTDRFGLSWQIVPEALMEMVSDPDPSRAERVSQAMQKMQKIEVAGLREAYERE